MGKIGVIIVPTHFWSYYKDIQDDPLTYYLRYLFGLNERQPQLINNFAVLKTKHFYVFS